MMKFILKTALVFILCITSFLAKAQIGYDYAQYDVGVAVGLNTAVSTDVQTTKTTPSVHFNFNYNQSPYVNYVFEVQIGKLKGGDSILTSSNRQFENHFTAYSFRVQLQAGEIIDYSQSAFNNAIKNFYVSSGLGYIVNDIVLKSYDLDLLSKGFILPGENRTDEVFIPLRLGYEFKIFNSFSQPGIKVDLGYQYNFIMGDQLDGYIAGAHKDTYAQYTIGLKFALGGVTSYRKQIHY